jgi:hypothetical protein
MTTPTPLNEYPADLGYGDLRVKTIIKDLEAQNKALQRDKEIAFNVGVEQANELAQATAQIEVMRKALQRIANNASSAMSFEMIECDANESLATLKVDGQ